jgi:hypothetical protein
MILASILTTRQYDTIELSMLAHPDLKTLLAGKDAGLLYHALKVTVDLLTAGIDVTRGGHAAKGTRQHTGAGAHVAAAEPASNSQ